MNKTCETCKYYRHVETNHGLCHRYPPRQYVSGDCISTETSDYFISVENKDWCGEFKRL